MLIRAEGCCDSFGSHNGGLMRSANLKSIKHNSECQAEYDESGTDRLCPLGKCPNQLNTDERVLSALRLFDKSIIHNRNSDSLIFSKELSYSDIEKITLQRHVQCAHVRETHVTKQWSSLLSQKMPFLDQSHISMICKFFLHYTRHTTPSTTPRAIPRTIPNTRPNYYTEDWMEPWF